MGYTYSVAQIKRLEYESLDSRSDSYNLLNPAGAIPLAIGEPLVLEVTIQTSNVYFNNQVFWLNWAMFRPQQRSNYGQFGTGYRLDITEPTVGSLAVTATLNTNGTENTSQNFVFLSGSITSGNTLMQLRFIVFVTNDTRDWLGSFNNDNESRFLRPLSLVGLPTQNTANSVFRTLSGNAFFELWAYESTGNTNNQPQSAFADPYVRNALAPALKSLSVPVIGKWYDRGENNTQNWVSATQLQRNALLAFGVENAPTSGAPLTNIKRKDQPFLSDIGDENFNILSNSLTFNGINYLTAVFSLGSLDTGTVDFVTARLINVGNISSATDFYTAYQANEANIPLADPTPAPNWYNGGVFGSPTTTAAPLLTQFAIQFLLDGTKLQFKGRYRIIFALYDTAGDFVSTHITPELVADAASPNAIGTPTTIVQTLQETFTNSNDVSLSFWERFATILRLNKAAYTGGAINFDNELASAELLEIQGGNILNRWRYDFGNLVSNANSPLQDSGAGTTFEISLGKLLEYRAGQSTPLLTTNTQFNYLWRLTFEQVIPTGTQTVTYEFDTIIRVRPRNTTRIPLIRFLDAGDFAIGIITPIQRLCSTDDSVVVEINKNAAPDANLAALVLQGITIQNGRAFQPAFEYESFIPVNLPQQQNAVVQQADAAFGDNIAYYTLDLTALRSNNNTFSVGAIIYNI